MLEIKSEVFEKIDEQLLASSSNEYLCQNYLNFLNTFLTDVPSLEEFFSEDEFMR